jgi:hypothetical protein
MKYSRLTPLYFVRYNKTFKQEWYCRCDCGNYYLTLMNGLKTGNTKSCGCWEKEPEHNPAYKHGHSRRNKDSREYICWLNIKARIFNPKGTGYKNYGARGIKMCREWADSFEQFLADMGPCPKGLEIDRVNVDGDYSPENCRWASEAEQAKNQRRYLRRGA